MGLPGSDVIPAPPTLGWKHLSHLSDFSQHTSTAGRRSSGNAGQCSSGWFSGVPPAWAPAGPQRTTHTRSPQQTRGASVVDGCSENLSAVSSHIYCHFHFKWCCCWKPNALVDPAKQEFGMFANTSNVCLFAFQAVSRTLHRKSCEEGPEEKEKCALQDRVNSISSYLRDRWDELDEQIRQIFTRCHQLFKAWLFLGLNST